MIKPKGQRASQGLLGRNGAPDGDFRAGPIATAGATPNLDLCAFTVEPIRQVVACLFLMHWQYHHISWLCEFHEPLCRQ